MKHILRLFILTLLTSSGLFGGDLVPFPAGNFSATPEGEISWEISENNPHVQLVQEGENDFLSVTGSPQGVHTARIKIPAPPDWREIRISARMRGQSLVPGDAGWKNARLNTKFLDDSGEMVGTYGSVPQLNTDQPEWEKISVEYEVPLGATWLEFTPGLYFAGGTADFDDITIEVLKRHPEPKDAELPSEFRVDWDREPVIATSPLRGEMLLNGWWRFFPANHHLKSIPDDGAGWGWMQVPGSWIGKEWPKIYSVPWVPGASKYWEKNKQAATVRGPIRAGWYSRTLGIPKEWNGREIVLNLKRVSTDAVIHVNGEKAGEVTWPGGELEITKFLKPDIKNTLQILVLALPSSEIIYSYQDADKVTASKLTLNTRGLIGDVLLKSRPKGNHITDIFLQPSTRKNALTVQFELANPAPGETLVVSAEAKAPDTKSKTFSSEITLPVEEENARIFSVTWDWPDARQWSPEDPFLYEMEMRVQSAKIVNDSVTLPLGFREFWIEGKEFYLNGHPIKLRPIMMGDTFGMPDVIGRQIDTFKQIGFNFGEIWPVSILQRGVPDDQALIAEEASRKGFLLSGIAPDMKAAIMADPGLQNPETIAKYQQSCKLAIQQLRNYPAVVMWGTTGNFFGVKEDQDPRFLGSSRRDVYSADRLAQAMAGDRLVEVVKGYDPTRPVFTHHGWNVGDVHTVNMYLNFIPLQERLEWLSHYRKHGEKPLLAVEFGTPHQFSFHRGRNGYHGAVTSEPLPAEFAAGELGEESYQLEDAEFRRELVSHFEKEQAYKGWWSARFPQMSPANTLVAESTRQTWRAWRMWGIPGGMIPWDQGHGWTKTASADEMIMIPYPPAGRKGNWLPKMKSEDYYPLSPPAFEMNSAGQALTTNGQASLAWIAGFRANEKEDLDGFTDQRRNYLAGTEMTKQIALINDHLTPQKFDAQWVVTVGGQKVDEGSLEGELAVSERKLLPIQTKLPVSILKKGDGKIELTARIGEDPFSDSLEFRVFPEITERKAGEVALIPGDGATRTLLERIGYSVSDWSPEQNPGFVVVGRRAFSQADAIPEDLRRYVKEGGTLLVMAQDPDWMRNRWGMRVGEHIARKAFAVQKKSPVLDGLDNLDLANWAGASRLLEPYPFYDADHPFKKGAHGFPYAGWRWGAHGGVSSAPIEKPHFGGWTPILEQQFDLAYSPLLETRIGNGRVILCTLDLEDQAEIDPAAMLLTSNLLRYVSGPNPAEIRAGTYYWGSLEWQKKLEASGLLFEKTNKIPTPGSTLIITPDISADDESLLAFVRAGGRLLVLPASGNSTRFGVGLKNEADFDGAKMVLEWPLTRGLSLSDLRYRAPRETWLLDSGCEVGADGLLGRKLEGKGEILFSQIDPDRFDADQLTYFRFTRWRHTRAITQILANMGGRFRQAELFFSLLPQLPAIDLAGDWMAYPVQLVPAATDFEKRFKETGVSVKAAGIIADSTLDAKGWEKVPVPARWETYGPAWEATDGEVVFRKIFEIPAAYADYDWEVTLGPIKAFDDTFLNGKLIGRTNTETKEWFKHPRSYRLPADQIQAGLNRLDVRVFNDWNEGGMATDNPAMMTIRPIIPDEKAPPSFYHPDYRGDFELGDDPFRYERW